MELSVLIPARNELFLSRTVDDLLHNIRADTEVNVVLDGAWADPGLPQDKRLNVIYVPTSIGQRAAVNLACRLSKAKYVMKLDSHCSVDKGFDRKMLDKMQDDWTLIPTMRNLHAFDWVCPDGHRRYQSPSGPCKDCGKPTTRDVVWHPKRRPESNSFRFDPEPHFQYSNEYTKREGYNNGIVVGYDLLFDKPRLSPSVISLLTDLAGSHQLTCGRNCFWIRQDVSSNTVSFSSVEDGRSTGAIQVGGIGDQLEMERVTTPSVHTDVVNDRNILPSTSRDSANEPSIGDSVSECFLTEMGTPSISSSVNSPLPIPTSGDTINSDVINKLNSVLGGEFVYSEKTSSFHNGSVALKVRYDNELTESMSIQGSCFMMTREKYWELNVCDESYGSWGSQGIEVACKTWLSGGKVMVNHTTWYAHMFRTQGGDFGFPYPLNETKKQQAKSAMRKIFFENRWPQQVKPLSWLIEKFSPVPGWTDENIAEIKKFDANVKTV